MPPKVNLDDPEVARIIDLFSKINYTGSKAQETCRNPKHVAAIESTITRNDLTSKQLDPKQGSNVVFAVTQSPSLSDAKRDYLVNKTIKGDLDNDDRIKTAIKYLASLPDDNVDEPAFDQECGVGVVVTKEQVESIVASHVSTHKSDIEAKGRPNLGIILGSLRPLPELRWASNLDIKNAAEFQLNKVWPKGAGDDAKTAGPSKAAKPARAPKVRRSPVNASIADVSDLTQFLLLFSPGCQTES